jgi:hypothetical protein
MTMVEAATIAATIAAQTIAQVTTRFNANTFRYLSQLPHLAMGLSRPMGYPWARLAFFGWPMKAQARRPLNLPSSAGIPLEISKVLHVRIEKRQYT